MQAITYSANLLSDPANAARLAQSLAEAKAGEKTPLDACGL